MCSSLVSEGAPGTQSLQYWLGGSSDNLENLLLNTVRAYVPDLQGADIEVAEPQLFLDTGIWHPCAPCAAAAEPAELWSHWELVWLVWLLASS